MQAKVIILNIKEMERSLHKDKGIGIVWEAGGSSLLSALTHANPSQQAELHAKFQHSQVGLGKTLETCCLSVFGQY